MDWELGKAKAQAAQRMETATYNPRKLAGLYICVAVGVALVLTVLNFLLGLRIEETGGLGGIGTRAVLSSVQVIAQYAGTLLMPFWELGFLFAAIGLARGDAVRPDSLLEGFRRFFPALRLMLLRLVIYLALAVACLNVSSILFIMTPLSNKLNSLLAPVMEQSGDMLQMMEQLPMSQLQEAILPAFLLFVVLFTVVMIPVLYRLRLAEFYLMDRPGTGALAALLGSGRSMRKKCGKLFRLDLSFWWFYLLQALVVLISYGDGLLALAGITLPVSGEVGFFVCYGLYAAGQILLHTFFWGQVQTTYALFYDQAAIKEPV